MGLLESTLVLALAVVAPKPVAAPDRVEASSHYGRGVKLYKAADFASAYAEFKAAWEASPSFEVLFNIGLTERRLFKYAQALKTLNRYLHEGGARVSPERRESVDDELAQIRQLTAPVAVVVEGTPARLLVDGEVWGTSPLADVITLGPGKHVIRAERDGFRPDEKTVDIVSGRATAVQLEPRSLTEPVPVTVEASPIGAELSFDGVAVGQAPLTHPLAPGTHDLLATKAGFSASRSDVLVQPGEPRSVRLVLVPLPRVRPFPWVASGVLAGGVGLGVTGFALSLQAQQLSRDVTTLGKEFGRWDATWAAREATGQRAGLLGAAALVAGGVAVVTGVALLAIHFAAPEDTAAVSVLFAPDPRGGFAFACTARF